LICPPQRAGSRSGLLSMPAVSHRARTAWGWAWIPEVKATATAPRRPGRWVKAREDAAAPIGLHECRHTAASWMNAAGVNPKVASVLMGHSTPARAAAAAAGAAQITLGLYTHGLPGDLELAREKLDAWIADAIAPRAATLWSVS
jgi:hypothetical protein